MWTTWGEPFSKVYTIKDEELYCKWWDSYKDFYSRKQIYISMRNLAYAVREGMYEEKYISKDPCKFLQGGMIDRGLNEFEYYHNYSDDPNSKNYDKNLDIFKNDK